MKTLDLEKFVSENFISLQKATVESKAPLFKGQLDPNLYDEDVRILTNIAKNKPLLPLQVSKILASAASLDVYGRVIYSGDTGIGKTLSGVAIAFLYAVRKLSKNPKGSFNAVVVAPPHLVGKWQKEAREALSGVIDVNIIEVNTFEDFKSLTKKGKYIPGFNIFVVSKNKNANTYTSEQVFHTRKVYEEKEYRWRYLCPVCNKDIMEPTKASINGEEVSPVQSLANKKITSCKNCGDKITQPTSQRLSPAEYLARYGKTGCIDLLEVDEIHEEKAKDTLRSQAFGQLVSKSKKVVGLTGTFLGGYASHAFFTLFRMFPALFKKDLYMGWNDVNEFVEEFGGSEVHYQINNINLDTMNVEKGRSFGQKERADLSPRLLDVLLPMIVFARLDEIKFMDKAASLPKYTEISHLVEHDEVFKEAQMNYLSSLASNASKAYKNYDDRSGYGKLKTDALLVPDIPFTKTEIELHVDGENIKCEYIPPVTRDEYPITNKEQRLVDIINEARQKNRKVLVYHDFVNSGLREQLMAVIEKHTGARVEELKSSVTAAKREAYLKALDCDVLVVNPELVKTGLDLLEYPTIIFFQQAYSSYNVFTLRQAAKRAWRIGQTEECEVHSIAYAGTMQQKALSLIGSKMNISQGVEGRLSTGSDIASEAEEENIQIAMARALLSNEKIESAAGSSSKTLDLNARDWTPFELFYLDHLEAFRNDATSYEALIPKIEIEVEEEIEAVAEIELEAIETVEEIIEAVAEVEDLEVQEEIEDVKEEVLAEADGKVEDVAYIIYEKTHVGRKRSFTKQVSADELQELVKAKGRVQLSLF